MQRALMIALLVAGMIPGTCAFAQPFGPPWRQQPGPQPPGPPQPGLQGVYGFTGTAACLVAPGSSNPVEPSGFDGALQPIYPTSSFSNSFAVEGIRIFHGDGTGVVNGTSVAITVRPTPGPPPLVPSFPPSAGSSNFSYNFTYTVDGNGNWTATMVPGSYSETFVTGPRSTENSANTSNQTATIDAIPPLSGFISQDGQTLTGAHLAPIVETITFSNGDVWPRICHRSRVYINLWNGYQHQQQQQQQQQH